MIDTARFLKRTEIVCPRYHRKTPIRLPDYDELGRVPQNSGRAEHTDPGDRLPGGRQPVHALWHALCRIRVLH